FVMVGRSRVLTLFPYTTLFRSDVLLNRRPDATERLLTFADSVKQTAATVKEEAAWRHGTVEERLSHSLVKGIVDHLEPDLEEARDRKSTRLNSSHDQISYAAFC